MAEKDTIERTFTSEELATMSEQQVNNVMMVATKVEGKGVVRRADGSIKYDNPERKGTYGEDIT
jgi:uncharacterized protein YqhQ